DRRLPPEERERPALPADPVQPGGPDRRRGRLRGRRAHLGPGHRRRQGVRRPVHDHGLQVQRARLLRGVRRLRGPPRPGEDRQGRGEVLRRGVEHEARDPAGQ
ncbi:hypothetical protein OXX69_013778, partial [Metschnikowia pulcherrima]